MCICESCNSESGESVTLKAVTQFWADSEWGGFLPGDVADVGTEPALGPVVVNKGSEIK